MFRRLKIQLIMINLVLTCIVLLIVFVGINTFMMKRIGIRAEAGLDELARKLPIFEQQNESGWLSERSGFLVNNAFVINIDKNGVVKKVSPNAAISMEYAEGIAGIAFRKTENKGSIKYNNLMFRYFKVPQNDGFSLVFFQSSGDNEVLSWLTTISLVLGGISVLLVFVVSLFLASKALAPIRIAWEKQQVFVADASHELRTPLAVMNTNLEIVADNPSDTVESQSKWLGNIQSEVKRMSKLVEDLLFLARANSPYEVIQKDCFSLSKSMEQVAELFEPIASEKNISLALTIQPDIMLLGHESSVKQLMVILLDNAVKHTPEGGSIELRVQANDNMVEVEVSDNGEGIPQEHLDKIFQRFYRVDKSRSKQQGGTGLGLAIAECIVKEHKGSIHVNSTVGTGSTFSVIFPRI